MKIKKAVAVTSVTLVGYLYDEFPIPSGNCFSVRTDTGENYRIVNFNYENFEELLENRGLTFPVKILPLSNRVAVIHDERIGSRWYQYEYCEVCCPERLLPIEQRLEMKRRRRRGQEKVCNSGNMKMISCDLRDDAEWRKNYIE